MLEEELEMTAEEILQMSNALLQKNLIDMFVGGDSQQLVFKLKDADQAMKCDYPPQHCQLIVPIL